ncbi:MAG: thiamine pyrophosphate-binding protein [Candidatus Omnitrophota bacterium]
MIKLSDYVFDFVARVRVKDVFLLPGGGCMHLVDSLGKNKKLKYVCCLHEQAAGIAAEAYSQYSNNLGVVLVTTGPGGTNAVTSVAGAWIDSIPLLVISGQVKRPDMIKKSGVRQMGNQEVDIISIVRPLTKYAVTILNPKAIRYYLEKAVYLARTGRPGPVWLDIPLDVQGAFIDEANLKGFNPPAPRARRALAPLAVKAINLLNRSRRPVILAGNGIRLSGALRDFIKLARILGIPVLATWKAIDFFPQKDKLFFGCPGSVAQRSANFIQQNSDLIMAIGARLDLAQTGYDHKNFAPLAKKVIVDIDPAEIRKLKMRIDVRVPFDAGLFIRELIRRKNKILRVKRSPWSARCLEWKKKYPVVIPEYFKNRKYVNTYVLVEILAELMTASDVLVPGSSGSCSEITLQSFKVKKGQRVFNTPGLGSMGFGLPAAMGACLAAGKKRTIGIIGDGGLQHNIQELETIRRLGLPVKLFILNNNGYASIRNTQKGHFKGRLVACDPSCGLTLPDVAKIAGAYGLKYVRLNDHRGIRGRVAEVLKTHGPVICEVMADPFLATAPRLSSRVLKSGAIVSKPMEDLWPFLEKEELAANMSPRREK